MKKIDAIFLLDDTSKKAIKTNVSNLNSKNIHIITSLSEISDELLEKCNKLIITEMYMSYPTAFSDIKLYKAVCNLEIFFLYNTDYWTPIMTEYASCFRCDLNTLTYETIQAALYGDNILESKDVSDDNNMAYMLASEIMKSQDNHDTQTILIARELLSTLVREEQLKSKLDINKSFVEQLTSENAFLHRNSKDLTDNFTEIIKEIDIQNKCMQQYEVAFSEDIYKKLNLHNYNTRPAVIYIKEYEELLGMNLFVETLVDVLRLQNHQSVKVLRLYDRSACRKIATLPKYYKVLTSRYYNKDIIANDFICKTGDYTRILDTLLLNQAFLDILIIIDCKELNDIVLSGSMLELCTCRNPKHLETLNLSKDNTIVNAKEDEYQDLLCWDKYELDKLEKDDKFLYLSSRPIIKRILQLNRLFAQSI